MKFYLMSIQQTLTQLNTSTQGLKPEQVTSHRNQYGENILDSEPPVAIWKVLLSQFNDFLVWILLFAALLSGVIGKWESSAVIVAVLCINAVLGAVQHIKADESLKSLKAMSAPNAKVIRDGLQQVIPASEVVVGDLVLLEAGDSIPADSRIIESNSLTVKESALTGESESVQKNTDELFQETGDKEKNVNTGDMNPGDMNPGDQMNMVFSGTFVTHGRGQIVITQTGMDTQIGKIAHLLSNAKAKKTPLQVSLDSFGKKLAIFILLLCAIIFAINVLRGQNIMASLLFAVSLAVAAIPEALSSIVTIVLALGTQKMAKDNAIIRKLYTIESLGCVSVICSDKTGTLTQNKMTVQKVYLLPKLSESSSLDMKQALHTDFVKMSMLCNDAVTVHDKEMGDPTEVALVNWGEVYELDELKLREELPRLSELPFDSDRKLMSSLHNMNDTYKMITKGAMDVLLSRATHIQTEEGVRPITPDDRHAIEEVNYQLSSEGLRVLCFAYKLFETERKLSLTDENDFVFYGLISMMDPPRKESAQAVSDCQKAGIKPIMITGDHKITATAIATQIGILKDPSEAVEGSYVESLTDEELIKEVPKYSVYARVSPEHKIRIVKAWQSLGHVVAMTGDGVNDAPALKAADVGIAMGITGTEVSKNASTMILTDDNFSTIVKAVSAGRSIYTNIKNAIQFLLAGNTAGILSVFYATLLGLSAPFAPIHLLFINLITDSLPAIGIGLEKNSGSVMNEPPRNAKEPILTRKLLIRVFLEGLLICILTMFAYYKGLEVNKATASTMAFSVLCLSRLAHGMNNRSDRPLTLNQVFSNRFIWFAIIGGYLILLAVLKIPVLMKLFEVVSLTNDQLFLVLGLSLLPIVIVQLFKNAIHAFNIKLHA